MPRTRAAAMRATARLSHYANRHYATRAATVARMRACPIWGGMPDLGTRRTNDADRAGRGLRALFYIAARSRTVSPRACASRMSAACTGPLARNTAPRSRHAFAR